MTRVALLKVPGYQEDRIREAMARGVEILGLEAGMFRDKRVLLKPNLLTSFSPERGACSHPAVVRAMAMAVQEDGGEVSLGDSPGFESVKRVARASGITEALKDLDIPLISFDDHMTDVPFPAGKICKSFPLGTPVVGSEVMINLARLKTHSFTGYTGAVKNLYGCLSGRSKAMFHLRYPNLEVFSRMLADLAGLIRPALSLVDGIVSMEGPGPRRGVPRETGFLIMSRDPLAADAVACTLVGMDPMEVLHLKYGDQAGYGCARVEDLEILGDPLEDLKVENFKKAPTSEGSMRWMPRTLARVFREYYLPFPRVDGKKCQRCGVCGENCPPGIIAFDRDGRPEIDYEKCIRCYCCQELCPYEAVDLKRHFLRRRKRGKG